LQIVGVNVDLPGLAQFEPKSSRRAAREPRPGGASLQLDPKPVGN
jgi:hypothetical protein